MTAMQPKHAQPSVLAALRWSSGRQWSVVLLMLALTLALLAALGPGPTTADASAPTPAVPPSSAGASGASGAPSTSLDGGVAFGLPSGFSTAPGSTTIAGPPTLPNDSAQASGLASDGIPATALAAYRQAAVRERVLSPACGLTWTLLAGIGRVESNHGRFAGATLHPDGTSTPPVVGIPLNGSGTARITDTDGGRMDGDPVYDRAVGPMQFIPSTWAGYGVDANGDGVKDPFNIFDAAAAAAHYLCVAGGDLTTLAGQTRAVRAYNNSDSYIALVLQLEGIYAGGGSGLSVPGGAVNPVFVIPTTFPRFPGSSPQRPTLPPVDPGPPLGAPKPPTTPKPTKAPPTPPTTPATTPATPTTPATSATPTTPTTPSPTPCPTVSSTPTAPATSPAPSPTTSPTPTSTACVTATPTGPVASSSVAPSATVPTPTPTPAAAGAGTSAGGTATTPGVTTPGTPPQPPPSP
jgi:hypothetical protein